MVPTIKIKTEMPYDLYMCRDCGRTWKSYYKRVGHSKSACERNYK